MILSIDLPDDIEAAVQMRIAASGQEIGEFVLDAVREKLARPRSFDEIRG